MDQTPNMNQAAKLNWEDENLPAEVRRKLWRAENKEAIEAINAYVEEHGLPLEKYRRV